MKKLMKMRIIACVLAFIIVFLNCNLEAFAAKNDGNNGNNGGNNRTEQQKHDKKRKSDRRTDIIVKYKNESGKDDTIKNVKNKSRASRLDQKNYFKHQKTGVYEVGASDDLEAVLEELNNDPNVEYAQPNYQLSVESIPTDEMLRNQWAIYNDGQEVDGITGRATVDINVYDAWNRTVGSNDVVIGILDTGIDKNHTELADNIYINTAEVPGNGIDDDGNGYIDDVYGWDFSNDDASVYDGVASDTHGTYVAGVIAAKADNGGITGVAPNVKILPLKFIDGTEGYTSDAIEAIEYAMDMGVKIINCSFGGTDDNQALKEAMQNSGILFVCSAGNGGNDTADRNVYPAGFDLSNVISVTSIDSNGILPPFANYGANVDIAAPGTSILGPIPAVPGQTKKYDYFSGTSVSAAIVSGVAALAQSAYPGESIIDIKDRIINYATPCVSLNGKILSGGRVDAFGTLDGTAKAADVYNGAGNSTDVLPTDGSGAADTWYVMDELASNLERFHYGNGGISPASGNYSVTCTDMSVPAPGFMVNFSRTYNSRNQRQTLLGRGWTFGFEGMVTKKGDTYEVSLPNGSSHIFYLDNGSYVGKGTRAILVKRTDNDYEMTTQDQYKYIFDASSLKMKYMIDRNGNRITLEYSSDKLTKITDTAGRAYNLAYNTKNLLSSVTDPKGRTVTYEYDTNNLLIKVTDPKDGSLDYTYDSTGYLTTLTDQNDHIIQQLTYSHDYGDAQNKVIQSTDAAGETWYYSYDMNSSYTTITNKEDKSWTYWFDDALYTVRVQDPEGKNSYTEYDHKDNITYFGDIKSTTDRSGNRTEYEVDQNTGNVTKITKPDGGIITKKYDQWNNVIEEVNERGNRTFYIYDSNGTNLLKKAQPLNGISDYVDGNTTDFAVTTYAYYTTAEANSLFGCNVAGLLESVTDPEENVTIYTYDQFGNTASVKDPAGNITNYTNNILGQKESETTAEGNKTEYAYDKNGQLIRVTNPDGGVKRTVYDAAGYTSLEVSPNQYDSTKDILSAGVWVYTGTAGTHYEWYDNGYMKASVDAQGNRTEYTWDYFGNKQTEKKPNGSIYSYEYDSMNRLTKTYFQDKAGAVKVLLSEVSYGILPDGNTQTTTTTYADDIHKSTTVSVKDFAGREIRTQYPDLSISSVVYNPDGTVKQTAAANGAITYYAYDCLGNRTVIRKPVAVVDGHSMYSLTQLKYDLAGNLISEKTAKPLFVGPAENEDENTYADRVLSTLAPSDIYTKSYSYVQGQMKIQSDSEGQSTEFTYDGEGREAKVTQKVSPAEVQVSSYVYNYLGKPVSVTQVVHAGDIGGNNYDDRTDLDIVTAYGYDFNGNLTSITDADLNVTEYKYDNLNRLLETKKQLKNDNGTITDIKTSQTYTWDGNIKSSTDARNNTTIYFYDERGNQTGIKDPLGNVTHKEYDRVGNNTAMVSPKNYAPLSTLADMVRTVFTYDEMGRVIKQTEIYQKMSLDGNFAWTMQWVYTDTKSYTYDALGNATSVTDALGNTTKTGYNLAGQTESVTDAETAAAGLSSTVRYEYNGLGQKIKEVYPGAAYDYTYDGTGNLLSTQVNGILKSTAIYDYLGRAVSSTDGRGNTTTMSWNAFGKVSLVNTPGDATIPSNRTIYQYDRLGNLKYTKDGTGKVTTYTYDSLGRNTSQKTGNESGTASIKVQTQYDNNGNITAKIDGKNYKTEYGYYENNKLKNVKNPEGQTTAYEYDANGNQTSVTNYLGNSTKNVYDGINRLVEVTDALGNIVQQIIYNDANAQTSSYDALHNETKFLYDRNLRQTGTINAEGNTSSVTYDTRGNVKTKTDGNGNTTAYEYDGENRLICVTDALGNKTLYSYDTVGNLLTHTDGNGNTTTFLYNAANLITSKIDPAGNGNPAKTESYTYYPNGLMKTKLDRNGVTTAYAYDIFGRKTSENAGSDIQTYAYDNNGNLTTMIDSTGPTYREYDKLNRNIKKIVPGIEGFSTYEYDIESEVKDGTYSERTTDPKENVTLKTYDKAGRLSTVTVGDETTTYEYFANGTRSKVTYPDGTTETYSYDGNNQVTSLVNAKQDETIISSYTYTYDGAGNQLTKTEAKGTTTYIYDSLNRLSSVSEPEGKVTTYTYDGAGNRKTEKVHFGLVGSDTVYNYDNRNRLISTISLGGAYTRYIYDNNGNQISKTSGIMEPILSDADLTADDLPNFGLVIKRAGENGTGTGDIALFTYDNYNRMTGTKSKNISASYRYNVQGYRVEKTVNGDTTRYLYEGDKVVLETDGSNKQTAFMAYGSNLLYRAVAAEGETEAQRYYYLYNAHGDVTSLIDTEGNIAVNYDYDAFGNILETAGDADNNIRYAGYQYDVESGLYYLNARYYDSVTARFISEDTYRGQANDPLSLNLYTYCVNNPIIYTDPSGHAVNRNNTAQSDGGSKPNNKESAKERALKLKALQEQARRDAQAKVQAKKLEKDSDIVEDKKTDNSNPSIKFAIEQYSGPIYVTREQLKNMGFVDYSEQSVKELNFTLQLYGITTTEQIQYFLSQCLYEAGHDKDHIENDSENYKDTGYSYYDYKCFKKDKNKKVIIGEFDPAKQESYGYDKETHTYKYEGAGYIQLTNKNNYEGFSADMEKKGYKDDNIIEIGTTYVAANYAWISSGYWWDSNGMNNLIETENLDIVQVSRCVNGGTSRRNDEDFMPGVYDSNGESEGWSRSYTYNIVCLYIN